MQDSVKPRPKKAAKRGGLEAKAAAVRALPPPPDPPLLCMRLVADLCGGLQKDPALRAQMQATLVEHLDEGRLRVRPCSVIGSAVLHKKYFVNALCSESPGGITPARAGSHVSLRISASL